MARGKQRRTKRSNEYFYGWLFSLQFQMSPVCVLLQIYSGVAFLSIFAKSALFALHFSFYNP